MSFFDAMKGNVGVDTSWHHATGNFCTLLYGYVLRKGSMNQFLGIGLFIIYSVCTMETKEFFVLKTLCRLDVSNLAVHINQIIAVSLCNS